MKTISEGNCQCKHSSCQNATMKICTPGLKLHMHVFLSWGKLGRTRSDLAQIPAQSPGGPPVLVRTCHLPRSNFLPRGLLTAAGETLKSNSVCFKRPISLIREQCNWIIEHRGISNDSFDSTAHQVFRIH